MKYLQPDDFVLEIGSGHNPKIQSDVLCDKFIDDDTQRGGELVTDRPLVEADGQYLPFADRSFDYVICSHVLEHVEDPKLMLIELMRIAKRGYIETPSEIAERLYGWPYHNWMVNLLDGRLILQKKMGKSQFGQLFHALAAHDRNFSRFHLTHHSLFLVQYEWEDKIDYQILPPDTSLLNLESTETIESLLSQVGNTSPWQKWMPIVKNAVPKQLVSKAKSFLSKRRLRTKKKTLREILVCPVCKGKVKWETDRILCKPCNINYPIVRDIPRMIPPNLKKS
jgi:uncharacterized protein YbaR (Trm112 family)/SAM-dependent methyltransferase